MYLVQDDAFREIGDKAHRVGLGAGAYVVVVEVDVRIVSAFGGQGARWTVLPSRNVAWPWQMLWSAHHLGERRLTALARALDQDHGRILQRFGQRSLGVTWIEPGLDHRLIVTFICG